MQVRMVGNEYQNATHELTLGKYNEDIINTLQVFNFFLLCKTGLLDCVLHHLVFVS